MSVTVELSELDAVLWDAFKRGGEWVNASEYRKLKAENAKLRELVDGLTWCSEHNCRQECPLYDVSEPDHCREASIKRELGVEVNG